MKMMPRSSDDRRSGFTLIELMMVAAIISLLAALAQPAYQKVVVKARAAEALGNIDAISVGLENYVATFSRYPAEVAENTVPAGLDDYLPDNFSFQFDGYVIDYDNFLNDDGSVPPGGFGIGLTMIPEDESIGLALKESVGTRVWVRGGGKYTYVLR